MIKKFTRAALLQSVRQVSRFSVTKRAMHKLATTTRGESVVFLRCRRVLPKTHVGQTHLGRRLHDVLFPHEFEKELMKVQSNLRFVHMAEALQKLEQGERLNETVAVLTFDESFAATPELVMPILRKRAIPATFFVTTGHLDGTSTLWDQCVHHVVQNNAPDPITLPWADQVMRTDSDGSRMRSIRHLLISLASLDEDRLKSRLEALFEKTGGAPALPMLDRMLTDVEVENLARDPLVSIGAHGHRHLALANTSDHTLDEELQKPRAILRDLAGSSFVDVVSYPFGRAPYVDKRVHDRARRLGIRAGFGAHRGVMRPGDHLFRVPRLALNRKNNAQAYELAGISGAIDEMILMATGTQTQQMADIEG